jgi:predicted ABC-type ATPase
MPSLYVIGGANGSGKTTLALTLLPRFLQVFEFVNADAIAAGLSPLNPESMAMQSGRLMLERLETLAGAGVDFAFETTLAARTFARFIESCKTRGYTISLIYLWLPSADLAVERVAKRVASGGHNIPVEVVRRRYERGLKNLTELYLPIADGWMIFNNSVEDFQLIVERISDQQPTIYNQVIWHQICRIEL